MFSGNSTSYIRIPHNNGLARLDDFTIEWFQYQTGENMTQFIFQIGPLSTNTTILLRKDPSISPVLPGDGGGLPSSPINNMGVSIELGTFYYSIGDTKNAIAFFGENEYKNKWVHFAVSRTGPTLLFFKDGVSFGTLENESGIDPNDIIIGTDSSLSNNESSFQGYIYGFHVSNGIGRYTSNFSVSSVPAIPDIYSVHYLTGTQSLGTYSNTEIKYNISTLSNTPFNVPVVVARRAYNRILHIESQTRPVLTNNLVYYTPGTLAGCGVGSAGNSRVKQRRT